MKSVVALSVLSVISLAVSSALSAEELGIIEVESTRLSDVSGSEVKSADLADALTRNLPSVSIVRRSGIANDIILRGQKKDNINILIDNTKVYGACPNRMDPPTSHVLTNTIESIEVIEGPYDVENFGSLSGSVAITTKKPSKDFKGEISLNLGDYFYRKQAATFSGGTDGIRFLLSASTETGAQYEDGDDNDFYDQIANLGLPAPVDVQYKDVYRGMDAFEKKAVLGKVFIDLTDKQELRLSYTANRSDDVLYPSSKMDALYDDSNILNVEYTVKDLGSLSKSLDIQYYRTDVEHPMSTFYRNSSGLAGSSNEKISALTTVMKGIKIKDSFDISDTSEMTLGIDMSERNWDGTYEGKGTQAAITGLKSIPDVDTENTAVFVELKKRYTDITVKAGARIDDTTITPSAAVGMPPAIPPSNDYSGFSANVFASYNADKRTRYFGGIGRANRVPDARELYFRGAMINPAPPPPAMSIIFGTPTLDETVNTELDLGMENTYENFNIKTKVFYSMLDDFIVFNATRAEAAGMNKQAFENVDATIFGLEVNGSYFASDAVYFNFGFAYQRGRKDKALAGQTDRDLAEVPPLKANISLNYEYSSRQSTSLELIAADAWKHFDADNGEQAISGYGVVNLKLQNDIGKHVELTFGIDNLFDRTYAVSNTYKDLTLLFDGAGDVMLINEPGRYVYLNATYKF